MRLKDKVAVVAVGGAGIGKTIAWRVGKEGAQAPIAEITSACDESTADAIHKSGGEALFAPTDLSS